MLLLRGYKVFIRISVLIIEIVIKLPFIGSVLWGVRRTAHKEHQDQAVPTHTHFLSGALLGVSPAPESSSRLLFEFLVPKDE